MASWKKVIVSGSTAELAGLTLSGDLTVSGGDITLGSTSIFSGGDTTSLNNIDAIDATTEATIESAIDTLGNLTAASSLVTVGTLDSGAISSGFGNIDNGTSTLNTGNATVDTLTNDSSVAASHITGSFTGSFVGDGSGLTGVTAAVDIDSLSAAAIVQTDNLIFSDAGTESKITFSDFEDTIFGAVSGDATIAAGGALTIAAGAVENSMLANDGITIAGADTSLGGTITAATIGNAIGAFSGSVQIDHDSTTNFVANEHIDHTSVTLTAGDGLTGGGDISSNRTFNVGAGTGVTVNANDVAIGQAVATNSNVTFGSVTVSNDVTINGDLNVLGDAVELQVSNLRIEDKLIEVASGSANSEAADGAGLLIGGANETLKWNHGSTNFQFSDDLYVSGSITLSGNVDGRDIASDGSKLDGIEASADVTDTTNVTAAGALMDSELTDLDGVKSLTVPNSTTISTFGASLVDDANASAARTTLGVDATGTDNSTLSGLTATAIGKAIVTGSNAAAVRSTIGVDTAGTDNSTNVTLSGTPNYITISGQTITRNTIDIGDDTNLSGGTGITLTGDTLSTTDSEIVHDNLSGFVANEHIDHSGVTLTAGNGLTGGGTIAASRTFAVGAGTGITVAADAVSTNDSEIVHDNLSGFVANEHIDHTSVTLTAGSGLTGGGTIASNRTFNVGAGTHITVNSDDVEVNTGTLIAAISGSIVTTANVTSAGALMDSEVDADIKTLSLPASTTISTFGKSLVDDADAGTARATLGVDAAGTDNSTDVTLSGTPNYITISGQTITRNTIDIGDDTNLVAGTNITLSGDTLNVDDAFLKNNADDTTSGTLTAANFITSGKIGSSTNDEFFD